MVFSCCASLLLCVLVKWGFDGLMYGCFVSDILPDLLYSLFRLCCVFVFLCVVLALSCVLVMCVFDGLIYECFIACS